MTALYNLCPNPSFEVDLTGYTALTGTSLLQVSTGALYGRSAMQVTTAGTGTAEGFIGPMVQLLTGSPTNPSCMQVALSGEDGFVQVYAVTNPGGVIKAQQTVHLTLAWQTIILEGWTHTAGDHIYLLIDTTVSQDLQFLVDGVMYEDTATADPYFDGSYPGASWTGTAHESSSQNLYPGSILGHGGMHLEGHASIIVQGYVSPVVPLGSGTMKLGGAVLATAITSAGPAGAMDDFAIYPSTDVDPAMSYAGWNNAGVLSGKTAYTRPWGIFYPPLDYPDSTGANIWNRAQYMALGMEYVNVAAGAAQNVTWAQVEMMPLDGNTGLDEIPSPSIYDPPRSVHLTVKPTRLNYCPYPSFEVSGGWSGFNSGTLAYDTAVSVPMGGAYDGQPLDAINTTSARVTGPSGAGITITLNGLFTGSLYVASIYCMAGVQIADFLLQAGTFISETPAGPAGEWVRPYVIFTAPAPSCQLTVSCVSSASDQPEIAGASARPGAARPGAVVPALDGSLLTGGSTSVFWADACLVEAGDTVGTYFDGDYNNPDYMWETGSTAGAGRSYYYENFVTQQFTIADILARHIPVGITYAEPQYAVLPTQ